jgi:hypothetical protein
VQNGTGLRMLANSRRRQSCRSVAVLTACALIAASITTARAGVAECKEAIQQYNSAQSDVADALRSYARCLSGSDGHDDCSSEFSSLRSAQDDFESAVAEYESNCS